MTVRLVTDAFRPACKRRARGGWDAHAAAGRRAARTTGRGAALPCCLQLPPSQPLLVNPYPATHHVIVEHSDHYG